MTDDDLKRAYQARHDESACPDRSVLISGAAGELTASARQTLADHLGRCARCAAEYRDLLAVQSWAHDAAPRAKTRVLPLYLGAIAAVLIAAVWIGSRTSAPSTPVLNLRAPIKGEGLSGLEPSGEVNQAAITFHWRAASNATSYRVVFTPQGSEVWRSADVTASEATVPETRLTDGSYYWQVVALRAGDVVGESNLVPFRIHSR